MTRKEGYYWIKACDPVAPSCDWEIAFWDERTRTWDLFGDKGIVEWSPEDITEVGPFIPHPEDSEVEPDGRKD